MVKITSLSSRTSLIAMAELSFLEMIHSCVNTPAVCNDANVYLTQWEAVDLNYWQTRDLEWYDPDAATTKGGKLEITLSEQPIHNLNFRSGMLQTWNKLCFNGGFYVEISASMPGDTVASGMWPGLWSMGNLGRAGYGATNDGMWRECLHNGAGLAC